VFYIAILVILCILFVLGIPDHFLPYSRFLKCSLARFKLVAAIDEFSSAARCNPGFLVASFMPEKKSKLAEIKTKPTAVSVPDFIAALPDEQKRKDKQAASGEIPVLWSNSIVGFGLKRYESPASGRLVDWFVIGFAPRKANLTVYLIDLKRHEAALEKLGKYKAGGGCLYLNKLGDVDLAVLRGMIAAALQ
jgi:hypothetical protein